MQNPAPAFIAASTPSGHGAVDLEGVDCCQLTHMSVLSPRRRSDLSDSMCRGNEESNLCRSFLRTRISGWGTPPRARESRNGWLSTDLFVSQEAFQLSLAARPPLLVATTALASCRVADWHASPSVATISDLWEKPMREPIHRTVRPRGLRWALCRRSGATSGVAQSLHGARAEFQFFYSE